MRGSPREAFSSVSNSSKSGSSLHPSGAMTDRGGQRGWGGGAGGGFESARGRARHIPKLKQVFGEEVTPWVSRAAYDSLSAPRDNSRALSGETETP